MSGNSNLAYLSMANILVYSSILTVHTLHSPITHVLICSPMIIILRLLSDAYTHVVHLGPLNLAFLLCISLYVFKLGF